MMEEVKNDEEAASSRSVHRMIQQNYKELAEQQGFGPFDHFNGGVEGFLRARLGEEQYSDPNALSNERMARCRLVNGLIKLMYDAFKNLTSPLSLFGFATLQADMRVPSSADGSLGLDNFQPLLAYVNNVIKGQRTDDDWKSLATGHGIQIERLRETIFMGHMAKGKWGRFATVTSYSFSLGFDVLTGKYLTNNELQTWLAAEGEECFNPDTGESVSSSSGEHAGNVEHDGSVASDSEGPELDFGIDNTVENALRQFLAATDNVTIRQVKAFLETNHSITIARADNPKFKDFVLSLLPQVQGAAADGAVVLDGVLDGDAKEADDVGAAPPVDPEMSPTEVARQQRINSTEDAFSRSVLQVLCHPLLTLTTQPHLTPLIMMYKEGKADRSHILGKTCVITQNSQRQMVNAKSNELEVLRQNVLIELSEYIQCSEDSEVHALAVAQATAIAKNLAPHYGMCRPTGMQSKMYVNPLFCSFIYVCPPTRVKGEEGDALVAFLVQFNTHRY
jgi:hypothetical protein